jgi:hypothetical protein
MKKIAKRQFELRATLWPELKPEDLWSRHTHDGFSTIPSSMTLILGIMDDLSKGQPVSSTYLELWCRSFDEGFVTLSKRDIAFHSGFSTPRADRTWKARLQMLHDLKFIDLKPGPSGPASYALIWNPYRVIRHHFENKTPGIRADKYHALVARGIELNDVSLKPPEPTPAVVDVAATVAPTPPPPMPTTPPIVWPTKAPVGS